MRKANEVDWEARRAPAPDDLAGWKRRRDAQLAAQIGPGEQVAAREQVGLEELTLDGVPVLEIRPQALKDTRRVVVHTHGGAYAMAGARSRLLAMPSLANATGMRIISVDYTTAPAADFGKGFAPTLIQEGTRTIFLSTGVRLDRKLDDAGQKPVIDMYEGMPHVFQDLPVPEAATAIRKSAEFIVSHLR